MAWLLLSSLVIVWLWEGLRVVTSPHPSTISWGHLHEFGQSGGKSLGQIHSHVRKRWRVHVTTLRFMLVDGCSCECTYQLWVWASQFHSCLCQSLSCLSKMQMWNMSKLAPHKNVWISPLTYIYRVLITMFKDWLNERHRRLQWEIFQEAIRLLAWRVSSNSLRWWNKPWKVLTYLHPTNLSVLLNNFYYIKYMCVNTCYCVLHVALCHTLCFHRVSLLLTKVQCVLTDQHLSDYLQCSCHMHVCVCARARVYFLLTHTLAELPGLPSLRSSICRWEPANLNTQRRFMD